VSNTKKHVDAIFRSFGAIFVHEIFSRHFLTAAKFPDITLFSLLVVTLHLLVAFLVTFMQRFLAQAYRGLWSTSLKTT